MAKYMLVNGNQNPVEVNVLAGRSSVRVKPGLKNALYLGEIPDSQVAAYRAMSRVNLFLKVIPEKKPTVTVPLASDEEAVTGKTINPQTKVVEEVKKPEVLGETEEEVPTELTDEQRKEMKEQLLQGREVSSLSSADLKDVFLKLGLEVKSGAKLTRDYAIKAIEEV